MEYRICRSKHTLLRGGVLKLGGKGLQLPVHWRCLSFYETPETLYRFYSELGLKSFLSNAHYYQKGMRRHLEKFIERFKEEGDSYWHFMDSGGFQLITSDLKKTQRAVYRIQRMVGCDIIPQLDFPIHLRMTRSERRAIINKNVDNFKRLKDLNKDNSHYSLIMPIIQPYYKEDIDYYLEKLKESWNRRVIGVGGIVPLLQGVKNYRGVTIERIIESFVYLRKILPNTFIHIFGLSTFFSLIAFFCGIDSTDSISWIKAGAEYRIRTPFNRGKSLFRLTCESVGRIVECECKCCRSIEGDRIEILKKKSAKEKRIFHNDLVFQKELHQISEMQKRNETFDKIEQKLKGTDILKHIQFINLIKEVDKKYLLR